MRPAAGLLKAILFIFTFNRQRAILMPIVDISGFDRFLLKLLNG
jgi:hypothetical protein